MDLGHIGDATLKDGRTLTLRSADWYDAADVLDYLNMVGGESDNLMYGKDGYRHLTVKAEAEYIEKMALDPRALLMLGFVDGGLMTLSQIRGEEPERAAHNFELSITVAKAFWGLGAGSAVMERLIGFAKGRGARAVHLGVRADNAAAIKLYEKFGFEKIGVRRGFFNIDGTYHDEILMDLYLY